MNKLNNAQLQLLGDFLNNLTLIFVGALIAPLFGEVDALTFDRVLLGVVGALSSFVLTLIIGRKIL